MKVLAQSLENPLLKQKLRGQEVAQSTVSLVINWLLLIGALAFIVQFVLGAIKWINSQGESSKLEEARKQITTALIGILIIFSLFVVIRVIGQVFGLSQLENLQISLPRL